MEWNFYNRSGLLTGIEAPSLEGAGGGVGGGEEQMAERERERERQVLPSSSTSGAHLGHTASSDQEMWAGVTQSTPGPGS